jgi:phage baseplate assembly protein W
MASIGFTMPFARSSGSLGLFSTSSTVLEAAKHDLRSLLLTNWGERPMHFDLGCNLREFLFNQIVIGETEVLVEERIRSQVSKWLPFLAINQVSVTFPTDHTISVSMSFFLVSRPDTVDNLSVEVSA